VPTIKATCRKLLKSLTKANGKEQQKIEETKRETDKRRKINKK